MGCSQNKIHFIELEYTFTPFEPSNKKMRITNIFKKRCFR